MRHEKAADHVAEFIAGADVQEFQKSKLLRNAVVQKLAVIHDAAARVSDDLTSRHPEVPWPQIVAFRNILIHIHAYFEIDWDFVWRAARNRCPVLREHASLILAAESGIPE